MPLYSGGETPPRFRFRAPLKPFVRLLIQCYTVKPAAMRAFLYRGAGVAMYFDPPPPLPCAGGVYVYLIRHRGVTPSPVPPMFFTPQPKKLYNFPLAKL